MFKYILCLSFLSAMLFQSSETLPANFNRLTRSIWPFHSTESEDEVAARDLISSENVLLLKQAGLGKKFNLSSHPVWKVHRYQGIDLKPVYIQPELAKLPELDARNPSVKLIEAETTANPTTTNTTEPLDLSFLDDLGALSYFLPSGDDIDFNTTDFLADAIRNEEESKLGFFQKLWRKIWDPTKSSFFSSWFSSGKTEEPKAVELYLPETQGSYAAVIVPEEVENVLLPIPAEDQFQEIEQEKKSLPANHANQFREETAAKSEILRGPNLQAIQVKPLARRPIETSNNVEFSRSKPWIQTPNPQVHVQGPTTTTTIVPITTTEKKISNDKVEVVTSVSQVQERKESKIVEPENQESAIKPTQVNAEVTINRDDFERAREILSKYNLPESIMRKLQISQQDVDDVLNNKESATKSVERLKAMQLEFEKRKEQLIHAYPSLRRHLPK